MCKNRKREVNEKAGNKKESVTLEMGKSKEIKKMRRRKNGENANVWPKQIGKIKRR